MTVKLKTDDVVKALDDTAILRLMAMAEAHAAAKSIAADSQSEVEKQIRELLGEATVGTVDGNVIVTNRWQNRNGVDVDALKAGWPDVWSKVARIGKHRRLDRKPGAKK